MGGLLLGRPEPNAGGRVHLRWGVVSCRVIMQFCAAVPGLGCGVSSSCRAAGGSAELLLCKASSCHGCGCFASWRYQCYAQSSCSRSRCAALVGKVPHEGPGALSPAVFVGLSRVESLCDRIFLVGDRQDGVLTPEQHPYAVVVAVTGFMLGMACSQQLPWPAIGMQQIDTRLVPDS